MLFSIAFRNEARQGEGAAPSGIAPTVTAAMGDRGGRSFGQRPDPRRTRRYFLAAEPQLWDYAPLGRDPLLSKALPPPLLARRKTAKLRYVEYTDDTFTVRVRPNARLGILGPVLRGVVGETLAVTFLNRTARPLSIHPHGVRYDRDSEGAYYGASPGLGAAVGPGAKFTYIWHLDARSGPLPGEPSSRAWLYHSHVQAEEETNLGLIGFLIVTDPARARADGTPRDVDREMAAHFQIFDESDVDVATREAIEHGRPLGSVPALPWAKIQEMAEQGERAAINGYVFGNLPGLEMAEGERVRWYLFGLGGQNDFHTAHWHGATVIAEGRRRTDVVELLPASMKVADLVADTPGEWLFHCHVAEHMMEGMYARFLVHPRRATGLPALAQPFFGAGAARASLQFSRAVSTPAGVLLTGSVTVPEAFSVFAQSVLVQSGPRNVTFLPGPRGAVETEAVSFRATNATPVGVVYGGVMEFELQLRGKGWVEEMTRPRPPADPAAPIALRIGLALHQARVRLRRKTP